MNWKRAWKKSLTKYWQLYLLLIPVVAYYIIFKFKIRKHNIIFILFIFIFI